MKRLTKAGLAAFIKEQLYFLRKVGFIYDPDKDDRQVLGGSLSAHQGYGRFRALHDLAKEFGIDPYAEALAPKQKRPKAEPGNLARDMQTLRGYGQTEGYIKAIREGRR